MLHALLRKQLTGLWGLAKFQPTPDPEAAVTLPAQHGAAAAASVLIMVAICTSLHPTAGCEAAGMILPTHMYATAVHDGHPALNDGHPALMLLAADVVTNLDVSSRAATGIPLWFLICKELMSTLHGLAP